MKKIFPDGCLETGRTLLRFGGVIAVVVLLSGFDLTASKEKPAKPGTETKNKPAMTCRDKACRASSVEIRGQVFQDIPSASVSPVPILMPQPILYPRKAVKRGWEGEVVMTCEILPDGSVGRMILDRTSGYGILDEAVEKAVRTWKFDPGPENEDGPSRIVNLPVVFQLRDKESL